MSVRFSLMQWTLVVLPILSAAQSKQFVSSARSGNAEQSSQTSRPAKDSKNTAEESSAEPNGETNRQVLNTMPLFGERPKTAAQIDQEIHFLNDCDKNFASRPEASAFFADRGWDYVKDRQLDTAAYRFNLAWLLNDKNADAYWGLGVVCYQKNHLADAVRMLKRGLAVADSNATLMADLATVEIKYFEEKHQPDALADAETHLQRAITLNPADAGSLQKLSVVYFLKTDYAKAWEYFHQARNIDLSGLDLSYLNDLLAKQPDPKGVFK